MLVLHCLTTIQLLKDSGCRNLSIRNFIFNMHTFWMHNPRTIRTLPITYMFFNKVPFSNQFFPSFQLWYQMTSHNRNQLNFIRNGLYPWLFHNPNLLKFAVNITNNFFGFFRKRNTFIINIMTKISSMASRLTTNILGEEKCNSRAWGKFICLPLLLDSSTLHETGLAMGGMKFSMRIWAPKKYLNLKLLKCSIGGTMLWRRPTNSQTKTTKP